MRDFDPAMAHVGQSRRLRSALALWPSPLHPEQDMADVCGTQVSAPRYWSLRHLLRGGLWWSGKSKNCCCSPAWAASSRASRTP